MLSSEFPPVEMNSSVSCTFYFVFCVLSFLTSPLPHKPIILFFKKRKEKITEKKIAWMVVNCQTRKHMREFGTMLYWLNFMRANVFTFLDHEKLIETYNKQRKPSRFKKRRLDSSSTPKFILLAFLEHIKRTTTMDTLPISRRLFTALVLILGALLITGMLIPRAPDAHAGKGGLH